MTTITKERLLTIKQWRETYGPGSNVVLPAEEAEELARIALASLEAEKVTLYRERNPYNGMTTGWQELTEQEYEFVKDNASENAEFRTVYTAPPATVVPDERAAFNAWNNDENLPIAGVGAKNAAWLAWQARAELGRSLAVNSPVTPDGWISCSERMPPQDDWILIYSKHGEYMAGQVQGEYVELSDGTLSWLGNVLFWMPLPEPPKGAK
ncbi:DUF551 domain-containing protein [Escherichia coli]|nr:DUF551 domain-containing protein [Escherichia coli]